MADPGFPVRGGTNLVGVHQLPMQPSLEKYYEILGKVLCQWRPLDPSMNY